MKRLYEEETDDEGEDKLGRILAIAGLNVEDGNAVAVLMAQLGNYVGVTTVAFEKARESHVSFSKAKWRDIAGQYNLPRGAFRRTTLPVHHVPACVLPPSLHITLFESSWRAADVYRDKEMQTREASRVWVLEMFLLPLIALFRGRIIDKPHIYLSGTEARFRGEISHEVFIMAGTLFLIMEVKLVARDEDAHIAELFRELLFAARMNTDSPWRSQLRVYGLLTDTTRFSFYSYDPVTEAFAFDEELYASGEREMFGTRMIPVTNKIFSVLLFEYIAVLEAHPGLQESLGVVKETALKLALEARDLFTRSSDTCAALEHQAEKGLKALTQSVICIPRDSPAHMLVDEPRDDDELRELAESEVRRFHEDRLRPRRVSSAK